jgi:pSer/pThr/pTyr-binding forkhead associated (FHA) protein
VDSLVIGTAAECDLRVADYFVSDRHCRVVRHDDGTLWVVDLGSLNGTWLSSSMLAAMASVFGLSVRMHDELRVRGAAERWLPGQTLWVGRRHGLELDRRGWVRTVSR